MLARDRAAHGHAGLQDVGAEQLAAVQLVGVVGIEQDQRVQVAVARRSEEHTSELQSPCNLVCRLLLEKKKEYSEGRRSINESLRVALRTRAGSGTPTFVTRRKLGISFG